MKMTESPVVDYMDWLKIQEEFVIYQMETSPYDDLFCADLKEELRMIREIKDIVKLWGMSHDAS